MKTQLKSILFMAALFLAGQGNAQSFSFNFSSGYDGWDGDFADYPVNDSIFYELEQGRTKLPAPLDTSQYAYRISGNNHSDDLFMFIRRKISGLQPNTTYQLQIDVEFASNAPTNAFGVGGPPGEGVTMKAGASLTKPQKLAEVGSYFMNIDKANQSQPGDDMDTIGHVGVTDTTTVYTLIHRTNADHLFEISTDSNGEVWVIIGTDSGFEATTTLYYNQIDLEFTAITGTEEHLKTETSLVFPNPAIDVIYVRNKKFGLDSDYVISDQQGKVVRAGVFGSELEAIPVAELNAGMYFIRIENSDAIPFVKR